MVSLNNLVSLTFSFVDANAPNGPLATLVISNNVYGQDAYTEEIDGRKGKLVSDRHQLAQSSRAADSSIHGRFVLTQ